MLLIKLFFLFALLIIIYTYAVYPMVLYLLPVREGWQQNDNTDSTFTVLTRVDDDLLEIKIKNLQLLLEEYGAGLINKIYVIVSSKIAKEELIVIKDSRVEFVVQDENINKLISDVIRNSDDEFILMWDCSFELEKKALLKFCQTFKQTNADCISGLRQKIDKNGKRIQNGAYTKYENIVRVNESKLGSLSVVDNGFYALKREAFENIELSDIVKEYNLFLCTAALLKKKKIVLDRTAFILEVERMTDNIKSHVESAAASYQNYFLNRKRFGLNLPTFIFISHKVLKLYVPVCMIIVFITNIFLLKQGILWEIIMILQMIAYLLFFIKNFFKIEFKTPIGKILNLLCYFIEINWSYILGFSSLTKRRG